MSEIPYICVLDFEATCESNNKTWEHEIIEFPSVLLKWDIKTRQYQPIAEFQEYCKPLHNITLTKFCTGLTGITQEQVNAGADFPDTLKRHTKWILGLVPELEEYSAVPPVVLLTVGHWDMADMMVRECKRWNLNPHPFYRKYINIKEVYQKYHKVKRLGMAGMLNHAGLKLLGRHHSGIDDCRNTGRLVQKLVSDGYNWNYAGDQKSPSFIGGNCVSSNYGDVIEVPSFEYKLSNSRKQLALFQKNQAAAEKRMNKTR